MSTTSLPKGCCAWAPGFALVLSLLLLCWTPALSQQGNKPRQQSRPGNKATVEPISKAALLKAVKLAAEARNQEARTELMGLVVEQVAAQGLDFHLTAEDEGELRAAGASRELLSAVRLKSEEQADLTALRDWKAIKESRQAADFEAYLKKHSKSEFAPLARASAEQLGWEAIKTSDRPADFEAFLQKHPESKFAAPARERLEQLEWEAVKDSDKTTVFEAYLKKYPEGKFVAPARERGEQLEWEAIKASDKAADFEAYLQKYPAGKFAALARERNEQLAWEAIKANDKPADFEAYLQKYPSGKFSTSARERVKRLAGTPDASPPKTAAGGAPKSQESLPVVIVLWTSEELSRHAIKKITPSYPARARNANIKGMVRVRVEISEGGKVTLARAIDGPAMLHGTAERAALQWVFRPAERAGAPAKAQGVIAFNFVP